MTPRFESLLTRERARVAVFLLALLSIGWVSEAHAARNFTVGYASSEYESQVLSAGAAEGDIWGGEQSTTPDDGPTVVRDQAPSDATRSTTSDVPTTNFWTRWWMTWMELLLALHR